LSEGLRGKDEAEEVEGDSHDFYYFMGLVGWSWWQEFQGSKGSADVGMWKGWRVLRFAQDDGRNKQGQTTATAKANTDRLRMTNQVARHDKLLGERVAVADRMVEARGIEPHSAGRLVCEGIS
jgi:hypothetical protein